MCTKEFYSIILFSYWYGYGGLWHLVLLAHIALLHDHDNLYVVNAS